VFCVYELCIQKAPNEIDPAQERTGQVITRKADAAPKKLACFPKLRFRGATAIVLFLLATAAAEPEASADL
jgi:hypothetical protein